MFRLKGCPRCKGDLVVERDSYGRYEWCLQCGYHLALADIEKVVCLYGYASIGRFMKHGERERQDV